MGFDDGHRSCRCSSFIIFTLDHVLIAVDLHLCVFFGTVLGIMELLVVFVHVCISVFVTNLSLAVSCWYSDCKD